MPVIPFREEVGNTGALSSWQIMPRLVNPGIAGAFTVIIMVTIAEQSPLVGVNVKVNVPAVSVLIVAGLHVPVTPFVEVSGKAGAVLFWQSGSTLTNTGMIWVLIVTEILVEEAHWPAVGVKV